MNHRELWMLKALKEVKDQSVNSSDLAPGLGRNNSDKQFKRLSSLSGADSDDGFIGVDSIEQTGQPRERGRPQLVPQREQNAHGRRVRPGPSRR